jgi:hypothetical protein
LFEASLGYIRKEKKEVIFPSVLVSSPMHSGYGGRRGYRLWFEYVPHEFHTETECHEQVVRGPGRTLEPLRASELTYGLTHPSK